MEKVTISPMATVYGDLIRKEKKQLRQVPSSLMDQVRQWLIDNGCADLAESEEGSTS